MAEIAIISGSGFYDFPGLKNEKKTDIQTKYGKVPVSTGELEGRRIAFVSRHWINHSLLPSMINHRANLSALKILGTEVLVSTTVCGVLDPSLPLGKPVVFKDIFFPENRLPGGECCTIFDKPGHPDRGHYMFDRPFSEDLRSQLIATAGDAITDAVYAHANGPRFNSKPEVQFLRKHASMVSQTSGPEVVLAGELEISCALLGFGIDYANGVTETPTPVEVLDENLKKSKGVFTTIFRSFVKNYRKSRFQGFVYRFK